jgi:D-alanine-D-alanine ligase-like ATP-grasp enzyme
MIEETVAGEMCRILHVGGRGVAAISWRTVNVEGDGKHTVAELVERKNAGRRLNPAYARFPLRVSEKREIAFLRKAGLTVDHGPAAGELVYLSASAQRRRSDRHHRQNPSILCRAC